MTTAATVTILEQLGMLLSPDATPRAVDIGLPRINLGMRATRGEDGYDL